MTASNSTTPAERPEIAAYPALITAVVTAMAAWKLFEPKLERIRAIRNEVGSLEPGFRTFYEYPQRALIVLSALIVCFLSLAFFDSLYPGTLANFVPTETVEAVLALNNIVWVLFSLGAVAIVIYWNVIPLLLLWLAQVVSIAPVPGLHRRFGPSGKSLGWHQAAAVIEGPDKGQPLLIDANGIERVAWGVLAKLSKNAGAREYAAEPRNLTESEKANIALFGCIMEANFHAQGWKSPSWARFYASLAAIQLATPMFCPEQILAFQNGQAFVEAFRDRLAEALKAEGQPCPPDRGLAAAADIYGAWNILSTRANGDVLRLIPWYAPILGGRMVWLDRRLREFPRLNDDEGMRPQLIKILVRWNILSMSSRKFIQPFSRHQAWLLLQEGALRVLPEMKEITFHSTAQVPIARIAAHRVIRRVVQLIEEGASSEAIATASALGPNPWNRLEAADFALWSWAKTEATKASGEPSKWQWKLQDNRIQRVA